MTLELEFGKMLFQDLGRCQIYTSRYIINKTAKSIKRVCERKMLLSSSMDAREFQCYNMNYELRV